MTIKRGLWYNSASDDSLLHIERHVEGDRWEVRIIYTPSGYSAIGETSTAVLEHWNPLGELLSAEMTRHPKKASKC